MHAQLRSGYPVAAALLLSALVTGCGGTPSPVGSTSQNDSEDESSNAASIDAATGVDGGSTAANAPGPGYYVLQGVPFDDESISVAVLLPDGTFNAAFIDGTVPSGGTQDPTFQGVGTYEVNSSLTSSVVTFTYVTASGQTRHDGFTFSPQGGGAFNVTFLEPGTPTASPWTLQNTTPNPTTAVLDFAADFTETTSGTLKTNGLVEVRYDTARERCSNPQVTLFVSTDGSAAVSQVFGAIKGDTLEVAFQAPVGHELAVWFEDQAPGCTHWDSNEGKNYAFAMTD